MCAGRAASRPSRCRPRRKEGAVQVDSAAEAYAARPWARHYPEGVPSTLEYPHRTIWEALEDTARRFGANQAFIFQRYAMTFHELHRHASRMATALSRL